VEIVDAELIEDKEYAFFSVLLVNRERQACFSSSVILPFLTKAGKQRDILS